MRSSIPITVFFYCLRISDLATFYCLLVTSLPQTRLSLTDFSSSRRKRNGRERFSARGLGTVGNPIWPNFEQLFPSALFSNLDGVVVTEDSFLIVLCIPLIRSFLLLDHNNNSKLLQQITNLKFEI